MNKLGILSTSTLYHLGKINLENFIDEIQVCLMKGFLVRLEIINIFWIFFNIHSNICLRFKKKKLFIEIQDSYV
jgi:hypothetical protein